MVFLSYGVAIRHSLRLQYVDKCGTKMRRVYIVHHISWTSITTAHASLFACLVLDAQIFTIKVIDMSAMSQATSTTQSTERWQREPTTREDKFKWLVHMLRNYDNLDSADHHLPDSFATPIEHTVSIGRMIELVKLPFVERLPDEEWKIVENHIKASDKSAFIACAEMYGSSRFRIVHEGTTNRVVLKPDVTLELVESSNTISSSIESTVIVNVEVNEKWRSYQNSLNAAIVFAMLKLSEHVLLCGDAALDHTFKALCIASCEYGMALALIEINQGLLHVSLTHDTANFFNGHRPNMANEYSSEPFGFFVLRCLFHNGHTVLTNTLPQRAVHPAPNVTVQLTAVLGCGSFAVVFKGTTPRGDNIAVKTPREGTKISTARQLQALQREWKVLRTFANLSAHLPTLYDNNWLCNSDTPYVCMRDAGVSLAKYVDGRSMYYRGRLSYVLHADLTEALRAALSLGYCHADMKPDNVICIPATGVLDWGLAVRPGCKTHTYAGGMAFFADALVLAYCADRYPIVYKTQYDTQAVRYICAAVVAGHTQLREPWREAARGLRGKKYVNARAEVALELLGHRFPEMDC